jgi:hypothetical protein
LKATAMPGFSPIKLNRPAVPLKSIYSKKAILSFGVNR